MKPIMGKIVIFIVCFAMTTIFLLLLNGIIFYSEQLPNGIVISANRGVNITFEDCDNTAMQVDISGIVSANCTVTSEFSAAVYPVLARLNYTNESHGEVAPFEFLYGEYFVQNPTKEANRYVVISDALSIKLFKNHDSIRQQLEINGEKYTVCGVYKQPTNILSRLSSDGFDQIYLSYSNLKGYETAVIQQFFIKNQDGLFNKSLIEKAQLPHNQSVFYDTATNFVDMKRVIEQAESVIWFLLGVNIIGFLLYMFVKKAKGTYNALKSNNMPIKQKILNILLPISCIVGVIAVFWSMKFDFFIPTEMLPPDNIFDVSFYLKNIVSTMQTHNMLGIYSFYWEYSVSLVTAVATFGAISAVMLIVTWWFGVKLLLDECFR